MNLLKKSKLFIYITLGIMSLSLVLVLSLGLNLGIDFTGGSVIDFLVQNPSQDISTLESIFAEKELSVTNVVRNDNLISIETSTLDSAQSLDVTMTDYGESISLENLESIGSVIGAETIRKSVIAVVLALVAVLFFIAYAFRNIPHPYSSYKFGLSALVALVHDVLVVLAASAVIGKIYGAELDMLFITALLTIIGFSVNDTIVVFDRVRENLKKKRGRDLPYIVYLSIKETLRRSIGTSATVIFILLSLLIFGGNSLRYFTLTFLVGVIAGTYSSIFVASPIFVVWESSKPPTFIENVKEKITPNKKSKKKRKKKILK